LEIDIAMLSLAFCKWMEENLASSAFVVVSVKPPMGEANCVETNKASALMLRPRFLNSH
jgi:hypothetical protein